MARRFGSAMISNTDSTLLVYFAGHIRVKAYNASAWFRRLRAGPPSSLVQRAKRRKKLSRFHCGRVGRLATAATAST
jgi:hypothetical protein